MAIRFEKSVIDVKNELKRLSWQRRNCAFEQINCIEHYIEALSWLFNPDDELHLINMKGNPKNV